MIWDTTCSDTVSVANVALSASRPGTIAIRAEDRKKTKYSALSDRFVFVPVSARICQNGWSSRPRNTGSILCDAERVLCIC